jgi:transaldolase
VVDEALPADSDLRGQAAIAQARRAYRLFLDAQSSPKWKRLATLGAKPQRPLWASTSTKNPHYSDTLYIDSLIAPNTVNTVPQATLEAYLDHGKTETTITNLSMTEAGQTLAKITAQGLDIAEVGKRLETSGVQQFIDSFNDPLKALG